MKTIAQINERIRKGQAVVVRADEMPEIVEERGVKRAANDVDVVTTGTFGAMCSSGAFINFGHSDPPIKIQKVWLNEVEAYAGLAAVDAYIGATELSLDRGFEYGGAHVIEDLIDGKPVSVRATSYGTDCYPRKSLETTLTLDDLNQAYLYNPRNNYQKYNAAVNSSDKTVYTYMGTLLPKKRNINYSGTGELSPLNNDPDYRTIGLGTRIFLGGAQGYVIGEGTQHSPKTGFGTIAVKGDLKGMSPEFLRAATLDKYGTTLYVGIGIPIPVLNEEIAKCTAVRNRDIETSILDYGSPVLKRPVVKKVNYEELISGRVDLDGKKTKASNLSSFKIAYRIADKLGEWIKEKEFYLTEPVELLPGDTVFKPLKLREKIPRVGKAMSSPVKTADLKQTINDVSNIMVRNNIDQVPVVDKDGTVAGIVTAWDITKGTAENKKRLKDIMTRDVVTSKKEETLDAVSRKLEKHQINSTPIVDDNGRVIGIITLSDINRVYGRGAK